MNSNNKEEEKEEDYKYAGGSNGWNLERNKDYTYIVVNPDGQTHCFVSDRLVEDIAKGRKPLQDISGDWEQTMRCILWAWIEAQHGILCKL